MDRTQKHGLTYAGVAAWAVDFVYAFDERPWILKILLRFIVGKYAYREFIGMMDELVRQGSVVYNWSYDLKGQEYHQDPTPLKWWDERKPVPKKRKGGNGRY